MKKKHKTDDSEDLKLPGEDDKLMNDGDSIEKYIEQKKLQNRILKEILEKIRQTEKK